MSLTAVAVIVGGSVLAGWTVVAFVLGVAVGRGVKLADEASGFTVPDEMPEEWRR